MEELRNSSRHS